MKGFFMKLKEKIRGGPSPDDFDVPEEADEGYVELSSDSEHPSTKVIVRPFMLEDFNGVKTILDSLREGYTIALVNIKPLKDVDLVELKRAINKLKKTSDAIEGDIAGFGEDWICITPSFARIHREMRKPVQKEPQMQDLDAY